MSYTVDADEAPIVVPASDDFVILVLDTDADEIVRPGDPGEIVREI